MDIDNLTVGQVRQIAALAAGLGGNSAQDAPKQHEKRPVIVCTDKRGVVFGYTTDVTARPISLTDARMCLYWSADVGGVFGLGEKGPTKDCKISATLGSLSIEGVTAIFSVDPTAEKAWIAAKVQGR